jgi:LasA protease
VKRVLALFIGVTFAIASCVSNASLWGQYATPTALPGAAPTSSPVSPIFISATPAAFEPILVAEATDIAPSPTTSPEVFVTQEIATSTIESAPVNMTNVPTLLYYTQSGDWLPAVAKRFGVDVSEITSPKILAVNGLLDVGTLLIIPDRRDQTIQYTAAVQILPDNEVVFSATALDFDILTYVKEAGGHLSSYREYLGTSGWTTGAGVIERTAYENSVNSRLLLALLDYEARWVRGTPENKFRTDYPFGHENFRNKGLFMQLAWGVSKLSIGYYGWRTGTLTEIDFSDGTKLKLDPNLNAGTVALMYFFSRQHSLNEWLRIMDQTSGFASYYQDMFGDPWARADRIGHLFPPSLSQPDMVLPFEVNDYRLEVDSFEGRMKFD